jgi:AcrR family transcriptional regulator
MLAAVAIGSSHDDQAAGPTHLAQGAREAPESGANGDAPPRQPTRRMRSSRRPGRGRPRDDAFDERILEAAYDELARCGISHFSVSAVARRANVAKGSIYLRWPNREQLMLDAVQLVIRPITPPKPGSFRKQLAELADHFAHVFQEPRSLELSLRIDADRYRHLELFAKMYARMQGAANLIVERTVIDAQHRGEIDPTVRPQLVTRMLTGSLFVEALAQWPEGGVSEEFRRDLVDFIGDRLELRAGRSSVSTAHE